MYGRMGCGMFVNCYGGSSFKVLNYNSSKWNQKGPCSGKRVHGIFKGQRWYCYFGSLWCFIEISSQYDSLMFDIKMLNN